MAKKVETVSLIDTFSEFKELKNIDRTTMVSVLEESFRSVIAKMFGTDENYDVIVNPDKGDFEIWRNREVVADEDLENPNLQIALSEAQKIDASYEVGEEVTDEVIFANFGRRAILNLRQTLASKILELEKDSIYNKYIDKVGTIINPEERLCGVLVPANQLSLAIGNRGQNAKLAAKLTGYKIDIKAATPENEALIAEKVEEAKAELAAKAEAEAKAKAEEEAAQQAQAEQDAEQAQDAASWEENWQAQNADAEEDDLLLSDDDTTAAIESAIDAPAETPETTEA